MIDCARTGCYVHGIRWTKCRRPSRKAWRNLALDGNNMYLSDFRQRQGQSATDLDVQIRAPIKKYQFIKVEQQCKIDLLYHTNN